MTHKLLNGSKIDSKLFLVPLQSCDLDYLCGEISDDQFLAILYQRDFDIENETYFPTYPLATRAEEQFQEIKNTSFSVLKKRLIKHAQLLQQFRHFMIIRLEPTEEPIDGIEVPTVLQKNIIIKRYEKGEITIHG